MKIFKISKLILCFCIGFVFPMMSQTSPLPLEEVLESIEEANTPEQKCELAWEAARKCFMYMKRTESLQLTKMALKIAESNYLIKLEVPILIDMGRLYESFDQLDTAIHYAVRAKNTLNNETENFTGKVYSFLGRHYQYFGELDSMLKYYTLAEDWNTLNEPYRNWVLYEQWHDLYIESNDYDMAKELLDKAYAITAPKKSMMDHGMLLYRYRMLASRKGDMDMFAKYTKEYYNLTKDKKKGSVSAHGFDLGRDLSVKEKIKKYEDLFTANKRIAFDLGNETYYSTMAKLLIEDKQFSRAKKYWSMIDTTDQSLKYKSDYEDLGIEIHDLLGNSDLAFFHLKEKNKIDELLRGKEKLKQIEEFNIQYETAEKEKQVALLESQDKVKSLELYKTKQSRWILLLGLLGTLFFATGIGYLYIQNRNKKNELEQKNSIIEDALKEKDILLREIHHRVKNNLQVISSILNLQSNYISDVVALEAINEGKNRVSSMALIHQNLYQDDNVTSINAKEYFTELISSLYDSYEISEGEVELYLDVDELSIDVDTMVPLGLVTNELVSNALKHAFTNKQDIKLLTVQLKMVGEAILLKVKDNGRGTTLEEFTSSKSFGNKLIQAFKSKLKADLKINNDKGTEFLFEIHNYNQVA